MFLFFAFEGAVTSQLSAIKDTESLEVYYIAMATLVRYGVSVRNGGAR